MVSKYYKKTRTGINYFKRQRSIWIKRLKQIWSCNTLWLAFFEYISRLELAHVVISFAIIPVFLSRHLDHFCQTSYYPFLQTINQLQFPTLSYSMKVPVSDIHDKLRMLINFLSHPMTAFEMAKRLTSSHEVLSWLLYPGKSNKQLRPPY